MDDSYWSGSLGRVIPGLCYSVEKNEEYALLVPGNVSIANLSSISASSISNSSASVKGDEYAANSYGIISLALSEGNPDDIPNPGTLFFADNKYVFCDWNCSYVFREANTHTLDNPIEAPVSAVTDRKVDIKAHCNAFKVRKGGDGTRDEITIQDGRRETNITIPHRDDLDKKVYFTSDSHNCGRDCSIISVFEPSTTSPWVYNCTVRMGSVENAKRPEHEVGERLMRLATSAIALRGPDGRNDTRTNSYPATSLFGVPVGGSTEAMEYLLSHFATGVLAAVIESNMDIVLAGQAPTVGQSLNVSHWGIITLILWGTAFIQLLVAVVATKVSERVVVPEGDPLSESKVMRNMLEENTFDEELKQSGEVGKEKPDWHIKVFDDTISEKWIQEGLALPVEPLYDDIVDPEDSDLEKLRNILDRKCLEYCIQELRSKAKFFEKTHLVPTLDASASIVKSDNYIDQSLHEELQAAFAKLKLEQKDDPDWHPRSNDMVQNLVHPSLSTRLWPLTSLS
ncbi:hypothetical protein FG05_30655 [Fusarium graminearum]|nr:hypothetical protein FG05_30655 [Fusarium graminearum]